MALNTVSSDRLSTNVKTSNLGTELIKKVGQSKNLIINGAMQVAQRGTSSTVSDYGTVDRFKVLYNGTDEAPTHAQVDLTSSDTPYTLGFRKALKITNGNQTSGAGASDFIKTQQDIEGQNISSSGWNVTDSNSKLTISYWVRSSVAQTFFGRFRAFASSEYEYAYSFALSANTWTKITKTIPGNSNFSSLVNTNAVGLFHVWQCFFGTDYTNNKTLDEWAVKDNANKSPDMTSTWYTTNDATFEITGVQLEVGSVATEFEHRSFAEELRLCYRYYYHTGQNSTDTAYFDDAGGTGMAESTTKVVCAVRHPVEMRSTPTITLFDAVNGSGVVTQKNRAHGIVAVANQSSAIGFQRVSHSGSGTDFLLDGTKPVSFGYRAEAEL